MSWREAARLSRVAYGELALQAIYAFRLGNTMPPGPPGALAARARRRVAQSKAIVGALLGLLALGGLVALRAARPSSHGLSLPVPPGVFEAAVLTALYSLDLAFLWWTGVQIVPTLLASGILTVLETLPIADRTLARAAGMLYLKLFDVPATVVLVGTPLAVGLSLGWTAGLAAVAGAASSIALALALALLTGRFFLHRIQGSRGGGGRAVARWTYLVLWLVPAFALFAFVTAAPAFFALLRQVASGGPSLAAHLLLAVYPYCLAALPAVSASGARGFGLDRVGWAVLAAASAGWLTLAAAAFVWVVRSVREVARVPSALPRPGPRARFDLRLRSVPLAVVTKDLRIASRTPGYAFLILLPLLDALVIGLWTYWSAPGSSAAFGIAFAAVTTAALLATFFGPAFFAVEVLAYSYGRTLPLPTRSLLAGKVLLVASMYLAAGGIVLGITLARVFDPVLFGAVVLAELPGVLAACLVELGILFRRSRTRGLPVTNLYAGAWYAALVAIPGLLLAGLPLAAFQLVRFASSLSPLLVMALVALGELALAVPFALGRGSD